jgi:hypothetical protein
VENRFVLSFLLRIISWLVILSSVSFLFWKCQFGVDLTDESFYALPAWKLFSLGDKPFVDEIFNAPRQSDWINYFTVARIVPFSMLSIRRSAVIFYALCLLLGWTVFFRKKITILGALLFATCLLFDINFMPTWSYNWWLRNALLIHFAFLSTGFIALDSDSKKKWRLLCFFFAGTALGVGWLAYNSTIPFQLIAVIPFGIWLLRKKRHEAFCYAAGVAFPIGLFVVDFLWAGRGRAFRESLSVMSSIPFYKHNFSLIRFYELFSFLVKSPFFWLMGLFVISTRFPKKLHLATCCLFALFLFRKLYFTNIPSFELTAFIAVALWGFVFVVINAPREEEWYLICMAAVTMIGVGLSSVARTWALAWAAPILWIVFISKFDDVKPSWPARLVLGLVFLFTAKEAFLLQKNWTSTFYDVPISEASTELTMRPLQGLRTSERRAKLIGELSSVVESKKFVLAFGGSPGTFLFGGVRSAIDTIFSDVEMPADLIRQSLTKMLARKREPELFVIYKKYPWTWGLPFPPTPPSAQTPYAEMIEKNGFTDYVRCARSSLVFSEPEVEVWNVAREKLESCISKI